MASIQDILRPVVITKVVSRIASASGTLLSSMGMNPGGSLERIVGGREASYDVFSNVRTTGSLSAPGAPAARRARNPVGRVPFVFPRMHEEVYLSAEEIHNISKLGGPASERDEAGRSYIAKQMEPPAQRLASFRTAMVAGMLRDSLYVCATGQGNSYFSYSSTNSLFQIDFKMPSGNKSQLDMLGGGSIINATWATASTNIPLHLDKINAAFLNLCGSRLEKVMCTSVVWNHIVNNDYVQGQAGTSNPPFTEYSRQVGTGPDGTPINAFMGRIAAKPWIEFEITDEGLELGAAGSETYTKHIDDTAAVFMPKPNPNWTEMLLGSEPVAEYDNGPWQVKTGASSWTKTSSNPTGWEIFTLDNALPVLYVPKSVAYGTVVF